MNPSGRTRVFALLGDPVAHSVSPVMHTAAFRALGLDALYVPLRCSSERLPGVMRALVEAGGAGNVTVPHKLAAASVVDQMRGTLTEACNTFWGSEGALVGENTDVAGILHGLEDVGAPDSHWLILGAGGSCRAVLAAACVRGASVTIRSRSSERVRAMIAVAQSLGLSARVDGEEESEVLINTTPLGLGEDDPLPITPFETPQVRCVLDLVYRPGETPLVLAYRERGIPAADGREVLIAQGAVAFDRWFPGVPAPVEVMRAAVRAALG